MLCSCHSYAVLVLFLELLNLLNARPQIMKPPLTHLDDSPDDDDIIDKKVIKRSVFKPVPYENGYNKTKERIINVRRRGSVTFSEQDIIFPDSYEVIFEPVPRIDGPPKCAEGSTFCESFDRYPYHHVRDILQRNTVYKDLFGKDEIPVEISNRVSGDDEMFVCGSIDKTIYPKIGKNKNSKWKYIINQGADDGFIQGVRIEICRNHGNACDIIGEVPNGYITYCKQKYVYRRMLSLSDSGTPVPDTFQLPSACCCAYKRSLDFLARFGSPITPAKIKR